ncbi:hypothetical protein WOB59_00750 [Methylocystis sp. IM4]|uniref:hypothetical protein n=1 Tax=Methylocystis sp. IM4 TaxID=3136560 RepID=UPI00311A3263
MAEVAVDIEGCYAGATTFVALTRCLMLDTTASRFDVEMKKNTRGDVSPPISIRTTPRADSNITGPSADCRRAGWRDTSSAD